MSDRLRSMQRIVDVQAQRKRLAEWRLAAIETRKTAIAAAQAELGAFVEAENLKGPLATLALKQTQRLAARQARTEGEREREHATLQAAERRHRLAERLTEAAATEARTRQERRSLEELIEGMAARDAQHRLD